MSGEIILKASGLVHRYGAKLALNDVSFEVRSGEIVGLLGLNGAGKTTCIRNLTGALMPSSGSILIGGLDVNLSPVDVRRKVGYLPESPPLYPELKVKNFLKFVYRMRTGGDGGFEEDLEDVLRLTGLTDKKYSIINTLSLGYRKRVGIAQAILGKPQVIILDEPVSGLDPGQIVEIRKLILSLGEERTVILSSHILGEIEKTCHRVLILHEGSLVADLAGEGLHDLEGEFLRHTGITG